MINAKLVNMTSKKEIMLSITRRTSVQKFLACFVSNEDLQNQITKRRQLGAINARKEWHCEFQNRCIECDKSLGYEAKYNRHWNRKHKLEWTEKFPLKLYKKKKN